MSLEYKKRRSRLGRLIGRDSIAILPTSSIKMRSRDTDYPFRANSDFYYFTGFSEPEAFSTYMIPLLIISLIFYKRILFSIFIAIAIFLSSSSLGILMVLLVFMYTIFSNIQLSKIYRILFFLDIRCIFCKVVLPIPLLGTLIILSKAKSSLKLLTTLK